MKDSPAPTPRAYGGDLLERIDGTDRVLFCPLAKGWAPRRERTLTTAEYPGTAVSWGDEIFEVAAAEPLAEGGVRYRLVPWREGHAIRRMEPYDAPSEAARAAGRADIERRVAARRLSIVLAPLAGLLPGRVQERLESEFGAPALAMTITSAAPLFLVGFLGVFDGLLRGLGGGLGLPGWLALPGPIAFYLLIESSLRLASAVATGQPMGSLPVVLAWEATAAFRTPASARRASPLPAESDADRFRMLEPLLSLLSPDDQRRLSERFGFDPIRWGRITAVLLLLVCGSNVLAAAVNAAAGRAGGADAAWLVAGTPLAIEQIVRLRRLRERRAAGSVLGALVRPLARRLLRAG
ncbi:MAG TPA: hypothetical protein VH854_17130 [Thermoanaerobaculia bacterium]|nr:hypothetical protein [Thermoanaerobaculia bacterium]